MLYNILKIFISNIKLLVNLIYDTYCNFNLRLYFKTDK